jgi:hypothetical protein
MTLPTFIVVGVAKAGTTSLHRYLEQHPQVYMYPGKGTNYFGYEDARDWKWAEEGEPPLLRHFHVRSFDEYEASFAGASGEPAIGEVSPQYFRCPTAAERIRERIPEAKLVASLRNPAERAFSGFLMRRRRGERVESAEDELTPGSSHVRESFYYTRMKRFFDAFPRDQVKVYVFEEFKRDPAATMADLHGFIGVDAGFVPDTTPQYNPANLPRSRFLNRLFYNPRTIRAAKAVLPSRAYGAAKQVRQLNLSAPPKLSPELRARLLGFYRDDIGRLEELLGRDLSVWLDS